MVSRRLHESLLRAAPALERQDGCIGPMKLYIMYPLTGISNLSCRNSHGTSSSLVEVRVSNPKIPYFGGPDSANIAANPKERDLDMPRSGPDYTLLEAGG